MAREIPVWPSSFTKWSFCVFFFRSIPMGSTQRRRSHRVTRFEYLYLYISDSEQRPRSHTTVSPTVSACFSPPPPRRVFQYLPRTQLGFFRRKIAYNFVHRYNIYFRIYHVHKCWILNTHKHPKASFGHENCKTNTKLAILLILTLKQTHKNEWATYVLLF